MKHKHYAKRGLALLLCAVMCMGVFSGCAKKEQTEKTAVASTVDYRKDGAYTTTVTLSGMSFKSNVVAEDITLVTVASEAYSMMNSEASTEEETLTEIDESLITSNVEVTSVTRKDGSTLEVSFVDPEGENNLGGYKLTIAGKSIGEKEDVSTYVSISTSKNVTCDTENVTPDTKTIKLTMTCENDNFSPDITAENISLSGSFEGMTIASVSSANKNLTLQLTGDIAYNEASGCYTDGFVYIDKDGFENGYTDSSVCVGVNNVAAIADSTTFAVKDGTASFDVKVCWDSFANKVSASDFTLDGASVTAFEKKDDTTGTLFFTVDGKSSANEIADAIFGKTLTIAGDALTGGKELVESVGISQASFYPVYDYAEESDGIYTITLILYAENGTFASKLSDDQVSFSDDFADAEISSLTRDSDTTATLILTIASGGTSIEDMDLYGTVILSKGALLNEWGENAEEKEHGRNYTYPAMGKGLGLSNYDINIIKGIVGGFGNTTFGTVSSLASGGISIVSGVYTFFELTGVVESEKAKLDKIYSSLEALRKECAEAFSKVDALNIRAISDDVLRFNTVLTQLEDYLGTCEGVIKDTAPFYNKINPKPTENLTYDTNGKCTSSEELQKEWDTYGRGYLAYAREELDPVGDYLHAIQEIRDLLPVIYSWLNTKDITVTDALSNFDTLCTYKYNFDAQSLSLRENYRNTILGYLLRAEASLAAYYLSAEEPGSETDVAFRRSLDNAKNRVNMCYDILENNQPHLEKDSEGNEIMYMYATGKKFRYALYSIEWPGGFDEDKFMKEVAKLGLKDNSKGLQEFLKRMEGRTLREELLLLGLSNNIDLNPILLDNTCKRKKTAPGVTWNSPHALCTVGFVQTANVPTTGETKYGEYVGYYKLARVGNLETEKARQEFKKWVKNDNSCYSDFNNGLCDIDNYFSYMMYYIVAAE